MKMQRIVDGLNDLKQRILTKWSNITQTDLEGLDGDFNGLTDVIASRHNIDRKQAKAEVEAFVQEIGTTFKEAAAMFGEAAMSALHNGKNRVSDVIEQGQEKATELWETGRQRVEALGERTSSLVAQRPLTAVAIAAGAGALLALLFCRRS